MNFTEKLDLLMNMKKINKSTLAKESGIPYTTIDGFYKKGADNVKLSTLKKLCIYFNCSIDYLTADENTSTITKNSITIQERTGLKIKALRELKHMSQTALAECVGYKDKTAIAKIEAGKIDLPQSKIIALANALGTIPSYFFEENKGEYMEATETQLKEIIIKEYGSLKKFCDKIDMPWTTLDSILKRGITNSNITNVIKITKELKIDTESLANGKIIDSLYIKNTTNTVATHLDTDDLTDAELEDVATYIEFVKNKRKDK